MSGKVIINGAKGRMGRMIADIISSDSSAGLEVFQLRDEGDVFSAGADIVIDFSLPAGAEEAFEKARENKTAFLTGVTNLSKEFTDKMKEEKSIAVFYSPNVSIGVYQFGELVRQAASLYPGYEMYMEETHHIHKKDAPSGTAKALAAIVDFPEGKVKSIREGEVAGIHTLKLSTPFEEITLTHKAEDRKLFADSAVKIAAWLVKQPAGFYSMQDYVNSIK
ncbi:4-hydroxy-tetrahydrodipicolinate reductase [Parelusimicrobium proximum]|uniref:4-hydroxy-tetrahydrodipicolinate reductase n=1 Tax=Parelusimicrobium proximum TaxID=3228953 RepID=UPI003D186A98